MDTGTMMLIGTGIQAGSRIAAGQSAKAAGKYNAAVLRQEATQRIAVGQREAEEKRREERLLQSKIVAGAAASGAGMGPSLLDVVGDVAQRGKYQADAITYGAEDEARRIRDRANLAKFEGDQAYAGSILEGIGSLALGFGRYSNTYGSPTRTTPIGPWRPTVSYG